MLINDCHYYGVALKVIYGMHLLIINNIKNHGKWCPHCAGNARLTLEDAKQIALSRNGKCLSTSYSNSKIPMTWKCHQGHIWSSPFHNIKNSGSWCPYCAGIAKLTLRMQRKLHYLGVGNAFRLSIKI